MRARAARAPAKTSWRGYSPAMICERNCKQNSLRKSFRNKGEYRGYNEADNSILPTSTQKPSQMFIQHQSLSLIGQINWSSLSTKAKHVTIWHVQYEMTVIFRTGLRFVAKFRDHNVGKTAAKGIDLYRTRYQLGTIMQICLPYFFSHARRFFH
jgi:hypothetical protein